MRLLKLFGRRPAEPIKGAEGAASTPIDDDIKYRLRWIRKAERALSLWNEAYSLMCGLFTLDNSIKAAYFRAKEMMEKEIRRTREGVKQKLADRILEDELERLLKEIEEGR